MKIKKYVAPTIKDALSQIKTELGENAVILNSKKVKRGTWGEFFAKEMFEVTAAIDEIDHPKYKEVRQTTINSGNVLQFEKPDNNIDWKSLEKFSRITSDVDEIKLTVQQMARQIKFNTPNLPEPLKNAFIKLINAGINEKIALKIIQIIFHQLTLDEMEDLNRLNTLIKAKLAKEIIVAPVRFSNNDTAYKMMFVGPTGSGKTTALAKVATSPLIYGNKHVAFISTDTYRSAAIEQIRTFANIASIPLELVYSHDDLYRVLLNHKDKDIILIDTPGRSCQNEKYMKDIQDFVNIIEPDEINLVLSVTTGLADIKNIISKYKDMRVNRLLFTKVDETTQPGTIINAASESKIALNFLTNGQNIPDDIMLVTPNDIVNLIIK